VHLEERRFAVKSADRFSISNGGCDILVNDGITRSNAERVHHKRARAREREREREREGEGERFSDGWRGQRGEEKRRWCRGEGEEKTRGARESVVNE